MACTPTPAKTLYGPSLSTSFSPSVSDLPSSVKTLLSTECAATATLSDDSTTCVSTTTVELLSTVAGGQTTIQVPIVVTVTAQPTQTLYARCPESNTPTRPTQTVIGSVVYTTVIVTSSHTSVTVVTPTTSSAVVNQHVQNGPTGGRSYAQLGPQIGGTVGGVIVVAGLVGLVWRWIKRRKTWDAMFEKGIDSNPYSNVDFNPSRFQDANSSGTGRIRLSTSEFAIKPKPHTYGIPSIPRTRTSSLSFGSLPGSADRNQFEQSYDPYQDVAPTLPSVEPLDYFDIQPRCDHSRQTSTSPLTHTLPTTHISPEPSIAPSMFSSYSVLQGVSDLNTSIITRPSPTRASSGGSSRPHTGGSSSLASRPSTSSSGHGMHIPGPTQPLQQYIRTRRNSSNRDDHSRQRSNGGRPVSPRTLMLANWNPSTDADSLDADSPLPAVVPPEYREGRGSHIGRAL